MSSHSQSGDRHAHDDVEGDGNCPLTAILNYAEIICLTCITPVKFKKVNCLHNTYGYLFP